MLHKYRNNLEDDPERRSDHDVGAAGWKQSIRRLMNLIPVIWAHEQVQADEERLAKLFKQLDRSGNGRIDIHDLSAALKDFGMSDKYAEVSRKSNENKNKADVKISLIMNVTDNRRVNKTILRYQLGQLIMYLQL